MHRKHKYEPWVNLWNVSMMYRKGEVENLPENVVDEQKHVLALLISVRC
jgi:hypothetical protein